VAWVPPHEEVYPTPNQGELWHIRDNSGEPDTSTTVLILDVFEAETGDHPYGMKYTAVRCVLKGQVVEFGTGWLYKIAQDPI